MVSRWVKIIPNKKKVFDADGIIYKRGKYILNIGRDSCQGAAAVLKTVYTETYGVRVLSLPPFTD